MAHHAVSLCDRRARHRHPWGNAYGFHKKGFFHGNYISGAGWQAVCFIQQESTFGRRSLWERAGALSIPRSTPQAILSCGLAFFQHAQLFGLGVPLGIFRRHPCQKAFIGLKSYIDKAIASLKKHRGDIPNRHLQALQLTGRNIGWIRRGMLQLGPIDPAPRVTYNWAMEQWVIWYV
jgi:hypothetical protein